jgi:hypothetical protein
MTGFTIFMIAVSLVCAITIITVCMINKDDNK